MNRNKPNPLITPTTALKHQIRRRHRQQIRHTIMTQFQQKQNIRELVHDITSIGETWVRDMMGENKGNGNGKAGRSWWTDREWWGDREVRWEVKDDRKTYKNANDPWNLKHLNTKIQNLCYELHNAPKNILSEMIDAQLEQQQEQDSYSRSQKPFTNPQNFELFSQLKDLVLLYIPHYVYIVEEVQRIENWKAQYENQRCIDKNFKGYEEITNPNINLPSIDLSCINLQKFTTSLIEILTHLSSIPSLQPYFLHVSLKSFPSIPSLNPTIPSHSFLSYYPYIHHTCDTHQPLKLLTRPLTNFIRPNAIFYQCMISIGNLLVWICCNHTHEEENKVENFYDQSQSQKKKDNEFVELMYQNLEDCGLEDILTVMFEMCNLEGQQERETDKDNRYLNRKFNTTENGKDNDEQDYRESCQQVLIWFTKAYTKFLSANQLPIYKNFILRTMLESYIYNKLRTLSPPISNYNPNFHHNQNHNQPHNYHHNHTHNQLQYQPLDPHLSTYLKNLTSLLSLCHIKLDNFLIINSVLPLIRANLSEPAIAKLWHYLTFNQQYDIVQLICMHWRQVNLLLNKDRSTVKGKARRRGTRTRRNEHEQQRQVEREGGNDSGSDETQQDYPHPTPSTNPLLTFAPCSPSPVSILLHQIFTTISHDPTPYHSRRNYQLLQGIYNLLLEMSSQDAKSLWDECWSQRVESLMEGVWGIEDTLRKIQGYLGHGSDFY